MACLAHIILSHAVLSLSLGCLLLLRNTLRFSIGDQLVAAEEEAKQARRGVWESYVEKVEAEVKAEAGDEFMHVTVCDIIDGSHFFVHAKSDLKRVSVPVADWPRSGF